jgi:phage terminase small subunit
MWVETCGIGGREMGNNRKGKGLTDKQEMFCQAYISNGFAVEKAGIEAGYSAKTAYSIASELLKKPEIQARIKELTEGQLESYGIKAKDVIRELAIIGFNDLSKAVDWDNKKATLRTPADLGEKCRAIQSIEIDDDMKGDEVVGRKYKIKFYEKTKALELLARHMRLLNDKLDVTSGGKPLEGPTLYLPDNGRNPK